MAPVTPTAAAALAADADASVVVPVAVTTVTTIAASTTAAALIKAVFGRRKVAIEGQVQLGDGYHKLIGTLHDEIARQTGQIDRLHSEIADLRERNARLEGDLRAERQAKQQAEQQAERRARGTDRPGPPDGEDTP